jgi:putative methionine-R-sulfoxide reductase with GAF domain
MDRYSIFEPNPSQGPQPVPLPVDEHEPAKSVSTGPSLQFPGDDGGRSLSEMAQRDLHAALQLLTERAQYITGASGAAIALRETGEMICRASAGPSAPALGAHLQVDSGLSGESVRTRQILRCDDAESDARVNRESCQALGIASVMVMPLIRDDEVTGVFELFSGRVSAFEERDIVALQRIAEMIQTAVDYAEAAKRAEKEIAGAEGVTVEVEIPKKEPPTAPVPVPEESAKATEPSAQATPPVTISTPERLNIRNCAKCGFPVSEGRTLCVDCEATEEGAVGTKLNLEFAAQQLSGESWLKSHPYLVGMLLVLVIVVVVLLLR